MTQNYNSNLLKKKKDRKKTPLQLDLMRTEHSKAQQKHPGVL